MDESRLQAEIRKYRFLLTKSLNINSISQVEADREGFFRALHREYKAAQDVIITAQLEIEADIASSTDEAERLRKEHWKAVTELCFNTLIWICLRWDRDRVKRVAEGALYDMCLNWVHPYWWAKQQLDEPSLEAG
ncbi:MAG: hypothetical protein ABSD58_11645 [Verrucomicrobiia bacterium]|jgi:hypothetical protein